MSTSPPPTAHPWVPASLGPRVVTVGTDAYEALRHSYAHRGSPAVVILCGSIADVSAGISVARSSRLPLSVRSGGHGVASSSTNVGGIVLDLSRLAGIEVLDPMAGLVRIGPGARWGDVAETLDAHGLAIGSGDSGDVGVGGLAVFGGVGLLGRKFGLTIDAIESVELVTADGTVRRASADENPDLFWAVRGAGSQLGVVTSFVFRASRVRSVVHAGIRYDASALGELIERWAQAMEDAPREVTGVLYLTSSGAEAAPLAECTLVYAGPPSPEARLALAPFTTSAPVLSSTMTATTYASLVPRTDGVHRGEAPPDARCGLASHLTPGISRSLADLVSRDTALIVQVRAVGGAVNDISSDETAYPHRHQNFCLVAIGLPAGRARLWTAWDELSPRLDGLYSAFETDRGPLRAGGAYPGAALERLARIKAEVDPEHVFEPDFVWPRTPR